MANFRYLVLTNKGVQQEYAMEAPTEAEARRRLQRQGMRPIRPLGMSEKDLPSLPETARRRKWYQPAGKFDVNNFTNRLAPLLEANVPLEKALAVIEESATDPKTLEILFELRRGLHEGKRFSELVRKMDREFPPVYASLIETGEEAGCLPEVAKDLRRFLSESKEFREFVVTSSIYPVIVIAVTLTVVVLLFTIFIPRFAKIFANMGRQLPGLTQVMLNISDFMVACWWLWPLLAVGAVLLTKAAQRPGKVKDVADRVILRLPLFGGLVQSIQIGHFVQTLAIMVSRHVHILSAVRIARRAIGNVQIQHSFEEVEDDLRGGNKLSDILGGSTYMPLGSAAMLRIAEESGEMGEMLRRIGAELEADTRLKVKRLLAMLEPLIILVLAVVVMLVVLAVFLAIWEMNKIK